MSHRSITIPKWNINGNGEIGTTWRYKRTYWIIVRTKVEGFAYSVFFKHKGIVSFVLLSEAKGMITNKNKTGSFRHRRT